MKIPLAQWDSINLQGPQRRRGGGTGRKGLNLRVGVRQRRKVPGQLQRGRVHDVHLHAQRQLGLGERPDPVVFGAVLFLDRLDLQDRDALKVSSHAFNFGLVNRFQSSAWLERKKETLLHERKYINQISAVRDRRGSPRGKL